VTAAADTHEAPHHDKTTCYVNYRCRRPECVERYNRNVRERMAKKSAGSYDRLVDAGPVRAHVKVLIAAGATPRGIAVQAGLNEKVVRLLLPLQYGQRQPAKHRVLSDSARKILAVTVDDVTPPRVNAVGTIRRIQALVADGWPMVRLAEQLDMSPNYVWQVIKRAETDEQSRVQGSSARRVAARYELLSRRSPTRHGVPKWMAARTRKLGADRRWPNSRYWADRMDVIDDPHFEPLYGVTRGELLAADARELFEHRVTVEVAAARLGVTRNHLQQELLRHPAPASETDGAVAA
jgi:DNA-binding CsgD family transcriptional regulator